MAEGRMANGEGRMAEGEWGRAAHLPPDTYILIPSFPDTCLPAIALA